MEITISEILQIIKKKIAFVLIGSLLVSIIAVLFTSFFVPKSYVSTVKLYVETNKENSGSASGYNNYNDRNYAVALVNTYKEMLNTNKFYSQLSNDIAGKFNSDTLKGMVSFSSLNDTEVFQASVSAPSPEDAKRIADSVAKIAPEMIGNLKENATLKIVDEAQIPKGASSPKPVPIAIAAFFATFLLLSVIEIIRKVMDVKIAYNDDMTDVCGVPVLAAIPYFDKLRSSKNAEE